MAKLAKLKERIEDSTFRILGLEEELEQYAREAAGVENLGIEPGPFHMQDEHDVTRPIATGSILHQGVSWQEDTLTMPPRRRSSEKTAIVDAGSSGLYFMEGAPLTNINRNAPKIRVGTASGEPKSSSTECRMDRPDLREWLPLDGHQMPGFAHNLVGIGGFCDKDCSVTYTKTDVTIYGPN